MVAMLNATSSMTSVVASNRFRNPTTVAKYQANKTSKPRPAKNVRPGLMTNSSKRKAERKFQHVSASAFSFQNIRDRRFLHLDFYVIGDFHDHGGLLDVGDQPVHGGVCHNPVACFQSGNQAFLFLMPLLLRPKQDEIHDDENENKRDEKPDAASGTGSRRAWLCLS